MSESDDNDLFEGVDDLEQLTDKEVAIRKREISKHVGMINKTVSSLKSSLQQLQDKENVSKAVVNKAEENYESVKGEKDKLVEIEDTLREEVEKRDIDVWEYYNES